MSEPTPVLAVRHLSVDYRLGRRRTLRAVDDVSLQVNDGETLALVGESGCGKSSIARAVMKLNPIAEGTVEVDGVNLASLGRAELKAIRHRFQMIFQDPIASLNPRRRVRSILEAPLKIAGVTDREQRRQRVDHILELTGMDPTVLDRYPHEFSGGQCQRLSIARALVLEPKLLVCDEPVSALDVSVRAQVLNLLNNLQRRLGLSMLFISHDLTVVRNVADRVAVMYLGRICEGAIFQHFFQEAGFDATLKLLDQGQNIRAGLFGNYQVNIWRYVDFGGDPDLNLTSYLTSTVTRHDVESYKPLLEKARAETNRDKRKQIYCDISQKFADDAVFMMPVQSTYYVLASPKVKDVAPLRNNLVQLRDIRIE